MNVETFTQALRDAMEARGAKQASLASAAGVSQTLLSSWLLGKVGNPQPQKVFDVENALDINPGSLSRHLGFMPLSRDSISTRRPTTFNEWLTGHADQLTLRQRTLLEGIYAEFVDANALAETEASRERRLADNIRRRDELAEENRRRRAAREPENH